MKNPTYISDKNGRHISLGDLVQITIKNYESMTPVIQTRIVRSVEHDGIKLEGMKSVLMFDDRVHEELEVVG